MDEVAASTPPSGWGSASGRRRRVPGRTTGKMGAGLRASRASAQFDGLSTVQLLSQRKERVRHIAALDEAIRALDAASSALKAAEEPSVRDAEVVLEALRGEDDPSIEFALGVLGAPSVPSALDRVKFERGNTAYRTLSDRRDDGLRHDEEEQEPRDTKPPGRPKRVPVAERIDPESSPEPDLRAERSTARGRKRARSGGRLNANDRNSDGAVAETEDTLANSDQESGAAPEKRPKAVKRPHRHGSKRPIAGAHEDPHDDTDDFVDAGDVGPDAATRGADRSGKSKAKRASAPAAVGRGPAKRAREEAPGSNRETAPSVGQFAPQRKLAKDAKTLNRPIDAAVGCEQVKLGRGMERPPTTPPRHGVGTRFSGRTHPRSSAPAWAPTNMLGEPPQPEELMRLCRVAWSEVDSHKYAIPFRKPVRPQDAPNYHSVIKRPMDLLTVKKLLDDQEITTPPEFEREMLLICSNAFQFNAKGTEIEQLARELKSMILERTRPLVAAWRESQRAAATKAEVPTPEEAGGQGDRDTAVLSPTKPVRRGRSANDTNHDDRARPQRGRTPRAVGSPDSAEAVSDREEPHPRRTRNTPTPPSAEATGKRSSAAPLTRRSTRSSS